MFPIQLAFLFRATGEARTPTKLAYNLAVNPLVYIETSIPSFYFEVRTEPEMVARKQWTRQWWDQLRHEYTLKHDARTVRPASGYTARNVRRSR